MRLNIRPRTRDTAPKARTREKHPLPKKRPPRRVLPFYLPFRQTRSQHLAAFKPTVVSGQWEVGSGKCSVVSGQWEVWHVHTRNNSTLSKGSIPLISTMLCKALVSTIKTYIPRRERAFLHSTLHTPHSTLDFLFTSHFPLLTFYSLTTDHLILSATLAACTASGTSWTRMIFAPPNMQAV